MSDSTNSLPKSQGYNSELFEEDLVDLRSHYDIPNSVLLHHPRPTDRANTLPPRLRTFFVVALDNACSEGRLPLFHREDGHEEFLRSFLLQGGTRYLETLLLLRLGPPTPKPEEDEALSHLLRSLLLPFSPGPLAIGLAHPLVKHLRQTARGQNPLPSTPQAPGAALVDAGEQHSTTVFLEPEDRGGVGLAVPQTPSSVPFSALESQPMKQAMSPPGGSLPPRKRMESPMEVLEPHSPRGVKHSTLQEKYAVGARRLEAGRNDTNQEPLAGSTDEKPVPGANHGGRLEGTRTLEGLGELVRGSDGGATCFFSTLPTLWRRPSGQCRLD
ncbi:hypothetical protein LIER_34120 [Lithospermum erythrorhizon]|uniref:Uncharacterized protein n=1 Tax=Lithospermum erythrorhizon TaxID=34254 RepID=A0AAV3S025_LITER